MIVHSGVLKPEIWKKIVKYTLPIMPIGWIKHRIEFFIMRLTQFLASDDNNIIIYER